MRRLHWGHGGCMSRPTLNAAPIGPARPLCITGLSVESIQVRGRGQCTSRGGLQPPDGLVCAATLLTPSLASPRAQGTLQPCLTTTSSSPPVREHGAADAEDAGGAALSCCRCCSALQAHPVPWPNAPSAEARLAGTPHPPPTRRPAGTGAADLCRAIDRSSRLGPRVLAASHAPCCPPPACCRVGERGPPRQGAGRSCGRAPF